MLYQKRALITFLLVIMETYVVLSKECAQRDPCACEMGDSSGTVDISSLGTHDRTPRFKDVEHAEELGSLYFSYNPCGGFDEGSCSNAAACSLRKESSAYQQIGNEGTASFAYDDDSDSVIVSYKAGNMVEQISTEVTLVCDPKACDPVFVPQGQGLQSTDPDVIIKYKMELTSVCACPGMCNEDGAPTCTGASTGLSGGSLVLIGFFSIVVIYIVGGVLFMKVGRKATGTDVIPNKAVWTSLPGLVLDGVKFTFCRCKSGARTYDKI